MNLSELDDLALAAADGDAQALTRLLTALETPPRRLMPLWPREEREAWARGLELVLESFPRQALEERHLRFLAVLRSLAFDAPIYRDLTAVAARRTFTQYPDPAGLIRALGILNRDCPPAQIAGRWELFSVLAPGRHCFHPAHGLGTIAELDGFSGSVRAEFATRQVFPLDLALESLVVVRPDSLLDRLLRRSQPWDAAADPAALHSAVLASLAPAGRANDDAATRCLVPAVLSGADFEAFLRRTPVAVPAAAGPAPGAPGAAERPWFAARTLEELADLLHAAKAPALSQTAEAPLRDLLARGAPRADQADHFALAVARLWERFPASAGLVGLLGTVATTAPAWQEAELFAHVSDGLPGRQTAPWFEATLAVRGPAWLGQAGTALPGRLFGPLARVMDAHAAEGLRPLLDAVLERIRGRTVSADALAWLWHSDLPERQAVADPDLVFKTLVKPVRGSYHKAAKELRRALFEPDFLRFLLHDGSEDAVRTLVSCIRHVPLLDKGEQQSLLVHIVRLFPERRHLVEEKQVVRTVRALDRITSIRSFELRRRELDEIVQVKIPANSRAIAHARGYGDLRENAEYKAAKDEQRLLRSRRAELEHAIHDVRSFDFGTVALQGTVGPGCEVTLLFDDGRRERYTVLGLWDGDPEKRWLSYESPLGKALLGHAVGDRLDTPGGEPAALAEIGPLPPELVRWLHGEDLL